MAESFSICVFGDAMVDEYYSVKIKGVSPEFPIPAMHSLDSIPRVCPGGAANVANQFLYFGNVNPFLASFVDEYSKKCFVNGSINIDFCKNIPTSVPIKRRFYSDGFPTYRWDIEKDNYGLGSEVQIHCMDLYNKVFSNTSKFDAIIFSDYGKGVFSPDNFNYIPKDLLTVVDSKSECIDKWFGCTVFKPNLKEAIRISGKTNAVDAGNWIRSRIKCNHVVITNADRGVTIVSQDSVKELGPLCCHDAVSVIGAGDCFTSILTLSLLEGRNIEEASYRAYKAGSIYVQNKYNKPITPLDLLENKYIEDPHLLSNRNFKLVFTNGCFDLLHNGHIQNLKFARSKGDKLVVALNNDKSVSRLKPGRPIQCLEDRISIISSLDFVDYVVSFSEDTPLQIINKINPDVLVKGDEYSFDQIVGSDIIKESFSFPMVSDLSTTGLVSRIAELETNLSERT